VAKRKHPKFREKPSGRGTDRVLSNGLQDGRGLTCPESHDSALVLCPEARSCTVGPTE
jgi:hypothetical protein